MAEHRWMKFWPQDWENDEGLKLCSLAARGLWIGMVCFMHRAKPYGHLLANGKPLTAKKLAALVGSAEKEVTTLLAELESEGVFSLTDEEVIYSRRMVKDHEASQKGREHVGKRWTNKGPSSKPNIPPIRVANTLEAEAEAEADRAAASRVRGDRSHPANGAGPPKWTDSRIEESEGRPCVNGTYLDAAAERLADAACLQIVPLADKTMIQWLADGYETQEIMPIIRRIVEREGRPPKSLAYFDKAVREARPTWHPMPTPQVRRVA